MEGIGKRIQASRTAAGIKQEELAEMVEISTNYLSAIEREVKIPKLDTLIRIINALQISADEILQDVVDRSLETKCTQLEEMMQGLPRKERERIIRVVEVLIEEARK